MTAILTPKSRVRLEKKVSPQLVKKFPSFYIIRRLIAASEIARHLSFYWVRQILFMPILLFNIILPSTPRSSKWFLPSDFPTKILYAPFLSPIRATCLTHLILHLVTRIIFKECKSWSSYLCSLLHFHLASSFLGPNISLTPYSRTPSAYVPFSTWHTKMRTPNKTSGKIKVLFVSIYIFRVRNWKTEDPAPNGSKHSLASVVSSSMEFVYITVVPKYLNFPPFQRIYYPSLCCEFVLHSDLETWPRTWGVQVLRSPNFFFSGNGSR